MSRQTFNYLCENLHEEIATVNTNYRDAYQLQQKLELRYLDSLKVSDVCNLAIYSESENSLLVVYVIELVNMQSLLLK